MAERIIPLSEASKRQVSQVLQGMQSAQQALTAYLQGILDGQGVTDKYVLDTSRMALVLVESPEEKKDV